MLAVLAESVRFIAGTASPLTTATPSPGAISDPAILATSLGEIDTATSAGLLPAPTAAARRARLLALHEMAPRPRALAKLRDGGYLSTADLDGPQARAILAPLGRYLFAE